MPRYFFHALNGDLFQPDTKGKTFLAMMPRSSTRSSAYNSCSGRLRGGSRTQVHIRSKWRTKQVTRSSRCRSIFR